MGHGYGHTRNPRHRHALVVAACGLVALLAAAAPAGADLRAAPESSWVTDGTVTSIVPNGARTFIAGKFSQVGPFTGSGMVVNATSGDQLPGGAEVTGGRVRRSAPDGAGGVYIVGGFRKVGGLDRRGVAHIRADGTVDPDFVPAVSAPGDDPITGGGVAHLAVGGGRVYVAGDLAASSGGQNRAYVIALDAATGALDTGFNAQVTDDLYYDNPVSAIALSAGRLYIAMTTNGKIAGQAATLAAVDPATGARDMAFTPAPIMYSGTGVGSVNALDRQGDKLYIAGFFATVGGTARANVAELDAATGSLTSWNPATPAEGVGTIDATADRVWFARGRSSGATPLKARVDAFDRTTGAIVPNVGIDVTDPSGNVTITSLLATSDRVYFGGNFETAGGQTRRNVAAIDLTGTLQAFNPDANQQVNGITPLSTGVYIGGQFTSVRGTSRPGLAALSSTTGALDTGWAPTITQTFPQYHPEITKIALGPAGQLLIAGSFTQLGGQARSNIGALSTSTAAVTSFAPTGISDVRALAADGSTVYVGLARTDGRSVLKLNGTSGATDATFVSALGAGGAGGPSVSAILPTNGGVLVGGQFGTASGGTHRNLALLDTSTGTALPSFSAQAGSTLVDYVMALERGAGDLVYVGGQFSQINGTARQGFAAINAATGATDPTFAPAGSTSGGMRVLALTPQGLAYGGNATVAQLGMTRATDGTAVVWGPSMPGLVRALAYDPGTQQLWVGTQQVSIDSPSPSLPSFARYLDDSGLTATALTAQPKLPATVTVGDVVTCTPAAFTGTPAPIVTTTMYAPTGSSTTGTYTVKAGDAGGKVRCSSRGENPAGAVSSSTVERTVAAAPTPPGGNDPDPTPGPGGGSGGDQPGGGGPTAPAAGTNDQTSPAPGGMTPPPAPPTSSPVAPFAGTTLAKVTKLTLDRRRGTRVTLSCPKTAVGACTGTVVLETRAAKPRRLARAAFTAKPGATVHVRLTLTSKTARTISRARSRATLRITSTDKRQGASTVKSSRQVTVVPR